MWGSRELGHPTFSGLVGLWGEAGGVKGRMEALFEVGEVGEDGEVPPAMRREMFDCKT